MKKSICCMAAPINFQGGITSLEIGLCPKCGERTEFADVVYKVLHEYDDGFYTTDYKKAEEVFREWKEDGCDGIRFYEAITPEHDDDEPGWELIDYYDRYEEAIPAEN